MSRMKVERAAFMVSTALFLFLFGFATSARGWFPNDLIVRAWQQGHALAERHGLLGEEVSLADDIRDQVHVTVGTRIVQPELIQDGMTLLATRWKDRGGRRGLRLIDRNGNVAHEWMVDGAEIFPDPTPLQPHPDLAVASNHGAYLYQDGDLVVNVTYVGLARLDACGEVVWKVPAHSHHSVSRADDGSFWVSAGTYEQPQQAYPGIQPTFRDRILHVAENGRVLQEIDVLDLLYANGLERYLVKGKILRVHNDLTHLNDVETLPAAMAAEYPLFEAGDVMVSLRNLDLVLVFDPGSERVKWHASDPFIGQHDPDFMGDGWIGVFDNQRDGTDRGSMLGGSRIVAVQPHTDSVRVLFPTPKSDPFYTPVLGKWQALPNGNLILTEGAAGRVVEVAPYGSTVWTWVAAPLLRGKVSEVQEGTRYMFSPEQVMSWPCPPPTRESGSRDSVSKSE